MDAATWGFIGTLVGAIVGSLASIITTVLSARNSRLLQAQSDSLQRSERAREFQRENLLRTQEALTAHFRLCARAHLEDLAFYRANPSSTTPHLLSEPLNEDIRASCVQLSLLVERISDDTLRSEIKAGRKEIEAVFHARSAQESQGIIMSSLPRFEQVMERIGAVLRSHY